MDDLTVLDGGCEEIIKQGKLSKGKPQINNSFIPILAYNIQFKSDRLFATTICIQHSTVHKYRMSSMFE